MAMQTKTTVSISEQTASATSQEAGQDSGSAPSGTAGLEADLFSCNYRQLCACVFVHVQKRAYDCGRRSEASDALELAGVTGGCELCDMGVGNWTLVLCNGWVCVFNC